MVSNKAIVRGPFTASVTIRDGILISRDKGVVKLSAAEADKLLQLLVSVMGIESYQLLPARLQTSPFECRFNSQRQIEARRIDQNPDQRGVFFSFPEGDDLIAIVKQAAAKFIDKVTIKGTKPAPAAFSLPDIPVEGR